MTSVSIAILAGGQSKRMGTDKSLLVMRGVPILSHVLTQTGKLGLPITLVTNSPEKYADYNVPMIADILPGNGSLGGLYTAIASSSADYTLCVACDMPFLNAELLRDLIERRATWDVVVPRINGYP